MNNKLPSCWPLESYLNKKVIVCLADNREIQGILQGYDVVGNIVLKDCIETVGLTPPKPDTEPRNLGTAVVRSPHIRAIDIAE